MLILSCDILCVQVLQKKAWTILLGVITATWTCTLYQTWVSVTSCHMINFLSSLPVMWHTGSRMQKYWFKVTPKSGREDHLVTIAPVSQRCPVKLDRATEAAINNLIRALQVCEAVWCVRLCEAVWCVRLCDVWGSAGVVIYTMLLQKLKC